MRRVRCRDCGRAFRVSEQGATYCPHCGRFYPDAQPVQHAVSDADAPLPSDLVPVARAANLAEAGFFQSVLEEHGIQAYIDTQHEEALAGFGARPAALLVPDTLADRAVEILETACARDADDPDAPLADPDADGPDGEEPVASWSWWKPLLVAAAFVAAAILVLRGITSLPAARRPAPPPARSGR